MDDYDFSYFEDADFSSLGSYDSFDAAEVYSAYDEPFSVGTPEGVVLDDPGSYGDIGESIFGAFVGAAKQKLLQATSRPETRPATTSAGIGAGIFEAIYLYGKGKTEMALESAIRKSGSGQRAIKNIENERIQAWLPWIIGGAIMLLLIGGFATRAIRRS